MNYEITNEESRVEMYKVMKSDQPWKGWDLYFLKDGAWSYVQNFYSKRGAIYWLEYYQELKNKRRVG